MFVDEIKKKTGYQIRGHLSKDEFGRNTYEHEKSKLSVDRH